MTLPLIAAIQMVSGHDLDANLAAAEQLMVDAARGGAKLLVLPETFALFSGRDQQPLGEQEATDQARVRPFIRQLAQRLGVWIVAGTVPVLMDGESKVRSCSFIVNAQGEEVARYDKLHLFDASVADQQGSYRESDTFNAGQQVVVVDSPFGRLGVAVCYDIRFPEFFRAMFAQRVDIVAVPAAFTLLTGKAHWLPLLRARAIENQCYIVGANQGGEHSASRSTSGGSVIIDGWGTVLAELDMGAGVAVAEMDLTRLQQQRVAMPVAEHQRFTVSQQR